MNGILHRVGTPRQAANGFTVIVQRCENQQPTPLLPPEILRHVRAQIRPRRHDAAWTYPAGEWRQSE